MNDTTIVNSIQAVDQTVMNAQSLAVSSMEKLNKLKLDRRNAKEMLEQIYQNDTEFQEKDKGLKEARLGRKKVLDTLSKKKEVYELKDKVKAITKEYNETKKALSDYLLIYQTKTGQLSFINPTGETVEIEHTLKPRIIKKSTFFPKFK